MNKKETLLCKGMAILIMLFHHSFYSYSFFENYSIECVIFPSIEWLNKLSVSAKVCVAIFVFLTGYGIAISCISISRDDNNSMWWDKYLLKRCIKLYTHYWYIYVLISVGFLLFNKSYLIDVYYDGKANFIRNLIFDIGGVAKLFGTPTLRGTWWYMSLALVYIIIIPIVITIVEKFGWATLFIPVILSVGLNLDSKNIVLFWMPSLILGIISAKYNLFSILFKRYKSITILSVCLLLVVVLVCCRIIFGKNMLLEAGIALTICLFTVALSRFCSVVEKILKPFGQHEYTIFLTHTMIREFFPDIIYSLKYPLLIWMTFLIISLLVAIVIDKLKSLIRIEKLTEKILCQL